MLNTGLSDAITTGLETAMSKIWFLLQDMKIKLVNKTSTTIRIWIEML